MPDGHECLRKAIECLLREEPEDGDGNGGFWAVKEPMGRGSPLAFDLNKARDEGGQDRYGKAHSHTLQEGDAAVQARETAGHRYEEAIVDGGGGKHGNNGED